MCGVEMRELVIVSERRGLCHERHRRLDWFFAGVGMTTMYSAAARRARAVEQAVWPVGGCRTEVR